MHSIARQLATTPLPALEARMLLMHVLCKTRIQLITQSEYELNSSELDRYQALVQRRMRGEPIAYLTGQREFYSLNLHVTPNVLIPRADTELLVDLARQHAPQHSTLLDLGTGSGAIAVALAHKRADLQVWACDLSSAALAVARRNAARYQCQIQFVVSDWFGGLPEMKWHTLVSNPPYIEHHDIHLSQGDLRFEPLDALTDHADGLSAYRTLIAGAPHHLREGGWLLLEHGYNQAETVRAMLATPRFCQIQSWRDMNGIERVSGAQLKT